MSIAEISLNRPITAIMFFVSMMVIGLIAAFRLPLEFFPSVEAPFAFIQIPYLGSTPTEVERNITRPVEEVLSTIPGIKRMNSQSTSENSQIFLEFSWARDITIAASEVRTKIDAIRDQLPDDLLRYFVFKFSTSDQPILRIRFASEQDMSGSYELLERKLKRPLERLPGVARAEISGVSPNEVAIELIADRITAHQLSLNAVGNILRQANFSTSAGIIQDGDTRFRIQPVGEVHTLEEFRNFPLNNQGLKLKDIAVVALQPSKLKFKRHLDLKSAVGIDIFKERSANLVGVGRLALDTINQISEDPELHGIQLYVLQNQAEGVITSLKSLTEAGIIGSVLSLFVLYFFLRHWPSTLMVSLAVPICLVMTLGIMYFLGITLNILSMMGLLLGVGMVIDNAVVAVESIYQQREKYPGNARQSSIIGVRNVAIALSAGTICHCIVFLPNIFGDKNFISIYLLQVAVTITISLLSSWLVAISLVPMLTARMTAPVFAHQESMISRWQDRYAKILHWTLMHRGKTMLITLALIACSMYPIMQVNKDMFPSGETREINLNYDLNGIYTLPQLEKSITVIEKHLLAHKAEFEIRSVYSYMSEDGGAGTNILLVDDGSEELRTADIIDNIREPMPKLAIGEIKIGNDGRGRRRGGGGSNGLEVTLMGDSSDVLHELSKTVIPLLRNIKELKDVRIDSTSNNSEITIQVDRERAIRYGFDTREVASHIGLALRGMSLREFRTPLGEVPVSLRFQNADKQNIDLIKDYLLRNPNGEFIPLLSIVDIKTEEAKSAISRSNRRTALSIQLSYDEDIDFKEVSKKIEQTMDSMTIPPGYRWSFGEAFDEENEAGQRMAFNTLIALLMIYVVMAAVFESLLYPMAILTSIVFSIFGVFWLFWLTSTTFSIMASIGILILMGIVVNNGIVMVEHINQLRAEGLSRTMALIQGSRDRLRPILMTMGTAILGMIPISLSTTQMGGDGPPYYPMARAIVGGLIFSTATTLFILPAIYALLDDWKLGVYRLWQRAAQPRHKLKSKRGDVLSSQN